jgi:hypothetical protein
VAKRQRDARIFDALASHVLAGGRVQGVVEGLIAAKRAKIDLVFEKACAIDLATLRTEGKSVTEAVTTSVNPRVIDCPDPRKGRNTIDAVAKDGIQLKVKARVTVRTNLERILGGATEETIIARVGEGIVSAIGSAENHKEVLECPDKISKAVLSMVELIVWILREVFGSQEPPARVGPRPDPSGYGPPHGETHQPKTLAELLKEARREPSNKERLLS